MGKAPCIHGDLCRAYMEKFGWVGGMLNRQKCIYSVTCPDCRFYEPVNEPYDHDKNRYRGVNVEDIELMYQACVGYGINFGDLCTSAYIDGFKDGHRIAMNEFKEEFNKSLKENFNAKKRDVYI